MVHSVSNFRSKRLGVLKSYPKKQLLLKGGSANLAITQTFLRQLSRFGGVLLRLLSTHWELVLRYPQAKPFVDSLIGEVLPDLDLSKPDQLRTAIEYVTANGFPESAVKYMNLVQDFFGYITVDVVSITPTHAPWAQEEISVVFQFPKFHAVKAQPGQSVMLMVDPENMVNIYGVVVETRRGATYKLQIDEITHSTQPRCYQIHFTCSKGYRHRDLGGGQLSKGEAVQCPPVRVLVEIKWRGPIQDPASRFHRSQWPEIREIESYTSDDDLFY